MYGIKYVGLFTLQGKATENLCRVVSRPVCAILPNWPNARIKTYARCYPPLPYACFSDVGGRFLSVVGAPYGTDNLTDRVEGLVCPIAQNTIS